MKKKKKTALNQDIKREIRLSFSRFISILLILMLGSFVFMGLITSGPVMRESLYDYTEKTKLYDIKISSPLKLELEDQALIENLPGIEKMDYTYSDDFFLKDDPSEVVRVQSLNQGVTEFQIKEGQAPKKPDQALVDIAYKERGAKTGDRIRLEAWDEDDPLLIHDYEITGFAISPEYMQKDNKAVTDKGKGYVEYFIGVKKGAFDRSSTDPTSCQIRFSSLRGKNTHSDEYIKESKRIKELIEKDFENRPEERKKALVLEGQEDIKKAEDEIGEKKDQLKNAEDDLSRADKNIEEGYKEYYKNKSIFYDQIGEGEKELKSSETQLNQARAQLDSSWKKYNNGKKEAEVKIGAAKKELAEKKGDLDRAKAELESSEKKYEAGLMSFEREVEKNRQPLDQAKKDLDENKRTLDDEEIILKEKKDSVLSPLKKDENDLQNREAGLKNDLKKIDGEIAELKEDSSERASLIETKEGKKEELNRTSQALAKKRAEIENINKSFRGEEETFMGAREKFQIEEERYNEELEAFNERVDQKKAPLKEAEEKIGAGRKSYEEGLALYNSGLSSLKKSEDESNEEFSRARERLEQGEKEYEEGLKKYREGKNSLEREKKAGEKKLKAAYIKLREGQDEYKKALEEYREKSRDADEKIKDAEEEIKDSKERLVKLEIPDYSIIRRDDNNVYFSVYDNSTRIDMLAKVFPVLFYAIALLVSLNTITRMVDERRSQIGTLKALGYRPIDIAKKYVIFGGIAGLIGSAIGGLIGDRTLNYLICQAYTSNIDLGGLIIRWHWGPYFLSLILGLVFTAFSAYMAVKSSLRERAAYLLRPRQPKSGSRIILEKIPFIWNRLSFMLKVTARNIFRYKGRAMMTILGVAGCTGLILMGFKIKDSVENIDDYQLGRIMKYDMLIFHNESAIDKEMAEYEDYLKDSQVFEKSCPIHLDQGSIINKRGQKETVYINATDDQKALRDMFIIRDAESGFPREIPEDGALINERLALILDLNVGDQLPLDTGNEIKKIKISGIFENYVGNYCFMTGDYYKKVFGKEMTLNADYAVLKDHSYQNQEKISSELSDYKAVAQVSRIGNINDIMTHVMDALNQIVAIIILASGALAIIVLYSLNNINVSERMRELMTIKVLGFYPKELTEYIYRESFTLTLIGIFIGYFVGNFLHSFIMFEMAPIGILFVNLKNPINYLICTAYTLLMSLIVMLLMHKKLKGVDMVEALKAEE